MKIFIFGPCHYVYLKSCALPQCKYYKTPLGNIEIDQDIISELMLEEKFELIDKDADEEEFSIEMQLLFLQAKFEKISFKIVPVLFGALDKDQESIYQKIFQKYFNEPNNLFIISTDFCHWGTKQKSYFHLLKNDGEIYESIEKLDNRAMTLIERHDQMGLQKYLDTTKNPICGKCCLKILLKMVNSSLNKKFVTKFIKYSQSFPIKSADESIITYAAGVTFCKK